MNFITPTIRHNCNELKNPQIKLSMPTKIAVAGFGIFNVEAPGLNASRFLFIISFANLITLVVPMFQFLLSLCNYFFDFYQTTKGLRFNI